MECNKRDIYLEN